MLEFQMVQQVKILFGEHAVAQTGELMQTLGFHRAMLVCDSGVVQTGIITQVTAALEAAGCTWAIFDRVVPDPPQEIITQGIGFYCQEQCDAIIAVGGGSSIDTGKGINILRYNQGPILRFTDFSLPMEPAPGLIAIPTTSGTGSELSDGLVLSDDAHNKHPILAATAMAEYAIIDPALMVGMPPHLTTSTGMDALAHCVESYTSTAANTITDQICQGSIYAAVHWLPKAVEDGGNIEARSHMAVACAIGGWMLHYGHTHAGHSVAHVLGSTFGIPHGFACAYALPWVLEFNAPATPKKTRRIGELFDAVFSGYETPQQIGLITRDAIIRFRDSLGIRPATDFPHDEGKFAAAAEEIAGELFQAFNPRKMTADDALEILSHIFAPGV